MQKPPTRASPAAPGAGALHIPLRSLRSFAASFGFLNCIAAKGRKGRKRRRTDSEENRRHIILNDAVGFMGSTAAPAVVRRAPAPNVTRRDEPIRALVPRQKPAPRASPAAPGAGALPITYMFLVFFCGQLRFPPSWERRRPAGRIVPYCGTNLSAVKIRGCGASRVRFIRGCLFCGLNSAGPQMAAPGGRHPQVAKCFLGRPAGLRHDAAWKRSV